MYDTELVNLCQLLPFKPWLTPNSYGQFVGKTHERNMKLVRLNRSWRNALVFTSPVTSLPVMRYGIMTAPDTLLVGGLVG